MSRTISRRGEDGFLRQASFDIIDAAPVINGENAASVRIPQNDCENFGKRTSAAAFRRE